MWRNRLLLCISSLRLLFACTDALQGSQSHQSRVRTYVCLFQCFFFFLNITLTRSFTTEIQSELNLSLFFFLFLPYTLIWLVFRSGWDDYKCCQGYAGSCSFGESACPLPCVILEACLCPGCAVSSTSMLIRERYSLGLVSCSLLHFYGQPDCIIYFLIACNVTFYYFTGWRWCLSYWM